MRRETLAEADVVLTKKNGYFRFYAKSVAAINVMHKWETRTKDNEAIYVAQITEKDLIKFITWLSVQGLLIYSKDAFSTSDSSIPIAKNTATTLRRIAE